MQTPEWNRNTSLLALQLSVDYLLGTTAPYAKGASITSDRKSGKKVAPGDRIPSASTHRTGSLSPLQFRRPE